MGVIPPEEWSLDFLLGYQSGFARGMEIQTNAQISYRQARQEIDETLEQALKKGGEQVIARLDDLILKRIENGDTPKKHKM